MDRTDPIPFHVARAYGLAAARPAQVRSAPVNPAPGTAPARNPDAIDRLVAAVVPGRVDFSGESPRPASAMPSLYRHPADRNAAATGVAAGRAIDVQG
ncbi:MAG: hypothetical protein IT439_01815 [Phycisphaerales bacterium]|nr:hypothetical protein [Phycisphaerales bacterium]